MKILGTSATVLLSVSAFVLLFLSFYSGKAIKRLMLNSLFGIAVLLAVNLTARFTGVHIPVNAYSVVGATVFSVPAVIGLLVLNLVII